MSPPAHHLVKSAEMSVAPELDDPKLGLLEDFVLFGSTQLFADDSIADLQALGNQLLAYRLCLLWLTWAR